MEAMARFRVWFSQLSRRCLLHTSSSGKPNNQPPHEEMNFLKAAEILFSETPRRKKFGWDFHLWQFFVACLPSFAVYLTAQYARHEMRRMEKERDLAAEEKAKALITEDSDTVSGEAAVESQQQSGSDAVSSGEMAIDTRLKEETVNSSELQILKARIDAMEEKVKEMVTSKAKEDAATMRHAESIKSTDELNVKLPQVDAKASQPITPGSMALASATLGSEISKHIPEDNKKKESWEVERPCNKSKSEGSSDK